MFTLHIAHVEEKRRMKAKFSIAVLSALLLFSCTPASTTPNGDEPGEVVATVVSISASGLTKTEYEINEQVSLNGLVVTAYMSDGTNKTVPHSDCTFNIPSTSTSGMKNATVTYSGKSATFSLYVKPASVDPTDPEDLDGFVAKAEAPAGATKETFTDWTSEMKAIFNTYLAGVIPPFFYMDELRVTYDNLDILQVRGKTRENVMQDYYDLLNSTSGYQAIAQADNAGKVHVYGRALAGNVLVSIDALEGKEYVTINFDKDVATSSWPADGLKQVFSEEYESIYTIPAYEVEGVTYIIEEDIMSNINILCLGAPENSVETYKQALLDAQFEVQQLETGEWTAQSRDKKIIVLFYYDGYGLMISTTHGEGENYASWAECVSAINEFGRTELRLGKDIAPEFPEITTGEEKAQYSVVRDVRGILKIVIHKDTTFKQEDLFKYAMKCYKELDYEIEMKGDYYWLIPEDKSFALYLVLTDYISDLGEVWSDITVGVCDYRIFEGYYVYYGVWPTAMVNTIVGKIDSSLQYPVINSASGVYYVKSNYKDNIFMDILNLPASTLNDYKVELKDSYDFKISEIENGFNAVDSDEKVIISCTLIDGIFHWDMSRYFKDTSTSTSSDVSFSDKSQLVLETDYSRGTWVNGPLSFVVDNNKTAYGVGNYGEYVSNPLRVYKNQKIIVSVTDKVITEISFKLVDVKKGNGQIQSGFEKTNLTNLVIEGLTLSNYNEATGVAKYTVSDLSNIEFVASIGGFGLSKVTVSYK